MSVHELTEKVVNGEYNEIMCAVAGFGFGVAAIVGKILIDKLFQWMKGPEQQVRPEVEVLIRSITSTDGGSQWLLRSIMDVWNLSQGIRICDLKNIRVNDHDILLLNSRESEEVRKAVVAFKERTEKEALAKALKGLK